MPGRPRSTRIDDDVRVAVAELLIEQGYVATTVDNVARRAGVPKSSLYRRWPSKVDMVFAAVVHDDELTPPADTGTLRGDLGAVSAAIVASLSRPAARRAIPGLLAEAFGEESSRLRHAVVDTERRFVGAALERAVARGELGADTDTAALTVTLHAQLLGTVLAWTTVLSEPLPGDLDEQLTLAAYATTLAHREAPCSTT